MWLKNKIFIGMLLLLSGCAFKVGEFYESIDRPTFVEYEVIDNQEDIYILEGFYALDKGELEQSRDAFLKAYEISNHASYLKQIIGVLILEENFKLAKEKSLQYLQTYPKNQEIRQVLVSVLGSQGEFKEAQKQAFILLKNKRSLENLDIVASVYFLQKKYQQSIKYLQEIYTRNGDEQVLHKIASIYYLFLKDQQKAISLYRAHIKKYGITPLIGENLALIYLQMKAYRQAGQIYEELYQETLNELYAKNALDIYFQANQANMDLAQRFLEKNPLIDLRDQMLLEIYSQKKDYKRAIETLQRLYEQTNDVGFLGFKAIMSYESTKNPSDEKLIQSVIKDLKEVVKEIDDALYWNYLGYLMIDHDINISEGMEYVKKALLKDPSNAYYLDSLAWGYYKLGDCKNAQLTIQEIPLEMVEKEKEIRGHFDVITQCVFKEGRL